MDEDETDNENSLGRFLWEFARATVQPDFMLSLFQAHPEARLSAIDLSGREFSSLAAGDPLQAILRTPTSLEEGAR